jgi:transcription-repair coupling factor (superfamily II helicase)
MRDMEIRGAGNFLGPEQSGHVHAVGYDLYCQMLREAIADLKGVERPEERISVRLEVEMDAYFPRDYIDDPDQRIQFYKRLVDLGEPGPLRSLEEELQDRYGRLPEPARNLMRLKELRLLAERGGVEWVRVRAGAADFRFGEGREASPETVKELLQRVPGRLSFQADGREGLRIRLEAGSPEAALEASATLLRVVGASDTVLVSTEKQ